SDRRATKIMRDTPRAAGGEDGLSPAGPVRSDAAAVFPMKHVGHDDPPYPLDGVCDGHDELCPGRDSPVRRRRDPLPGKPPDLDEIAWCDTVLPSQRRPRPPDCGARKLFRAVLLRAVEDLHGRGWRTSAALRASARAWFASDDASWLASFVNVCEALGLHPERVRAAMTLKALPSAPTSCTRGRGLSGRIRSNSRRRPGSPRRSSAP